MTVLSAAGGGATLTATVLTADDHDSSYFVALKEFTGINVAGPVRKDHAPFGRFLRSRWLLGGGCIQVVVTTGDTPKAAGRGVGGGPAGC